MKKQIEREDQNRRNCLKMLDDEFRFFKFWQWSNNNDEPIFPIFTRIDATVGSLGDKASKRLGLDRDECNMLLVGPNENTDNIYHVDETESIAEAFSRIGVTINSNGYKFVIDELDEEDLYWECFNFLDSLD